MNTIGRRGLLRTLSLPFAASLLPALAAAPNDKRIALVIGSGADL